MTKTNPTLLVTALLYSMPGHTMPITDTVSVNAIEWAQTDLFRSVTWNEIDALCPAGSRSCSQGSELKGFDLSGWTWASAADVNVLFNTYLIEAGYNGDALLGDGADRFFSRPPENDFAELLFEDFSPIVSVGSSFSFTDVYGLLAEESGLADQVYVAIMSRAQFGADVSYEASTRAQAGKDTVWRGGAWFYRDASPVSAPGSAALVVLCMLGLRWGKRKVLTN